MSSTPEVQVRIDARYWLYRSALPDPWTYSTCTRLPDCPSPSQTMLAADAAASELSGATDLLTSVPAKDASGPCVQAPGTFLTSNSPLQRPVPTLNPSYTSPRALSFAGI